MKKRVLNRKKTIINILDKISSSIGYSINMMKFNERLEDDQFLIDAAVFCEVKAEYR